MAGNEEEDGQGFLKFDAEEIKDNGKIEKLRETLCR